ncbi:hypothetical protein RRG08_051092 [Elysia crispata]|uniref:Uncharacterized protein n=1 Tax=Elysia crispata TaxID=231223 RepID=A0AAE1AI05_9GAST|nr:hypothetical protein RRG08_051092 [Elysia crispata]
MSFIIVRLTWGDGSQDRKCPLEGGRHDRRADHFRVDRRQNDNSGRQTHTGSPDWLKRTDSSSHKLSRLVEEDRQQLTQAKQAG